MLKNKKIAETINTKAVEEFLENNISFFNSRLDLLSKLIPNHNFQSSDSGPKIIDFQFYVIEELRKNNNRLRNNITDITNITKHNLEVQNQIQQSIIALLEAQSLEDLIKIITNKLPLLLGITSSLLLFWSGDKEVKAKLSKDFVIAPKKLVQTIKSNVVTLRKNLDDSNKKLYNSNKINSDALLKLPLEDKKGFIILLLGSNTDNYFNDHQATDLLAFLALILQVCFKKHLHE